jgi:hypothetical protein
VDYDRWADIQRHWGALHEHFTSTTYPPTSSSTSQVSRVVQPAPPQWLNRFVDPAGTRSAGKDLSLARPAAQPPLVNHGPICASTHRECLLMAFWAATTRSLHAQYPIQLRSVISVREMPHRQPAPRGHVCQSSLGLQPRSDLPPAIRGVTPGRIPGLTKSRRAWMCL